MGRGREMGEGGQKIQTPNKEKRRATVGSQWRYRKQADFLGKLEKGEASAERPARARTPFGKQEGEGAVIVRCSAHR